MTNPVIAHVMRGGNLESCHRGAGVLVGRNGRIHGQWGDCSSPIFPRSAIKAFQCLPLVASGAADAFGLENRELALCCASHDGEPQHVEVARSILRKAGVDETCYECGAHWPSSSSAARDIARANGQALAVHNNCSGKHAGMLALAKHIGAPLSGYTHIDHSVQQHVAETLTAFCDYDLANTAVGIDGCSVPTWAIPLENIAQGFAKFTDTANVDTARIITAVREHPVMVGGSKNFDSQMMERIPRLFIKVGAEGVYCGCIAHAGLGFAVKCDDGGIRAAQVAVAGMLATLDVWTQDELDNLKSAATTELRNWSGIHVGDITCAVT
jgi:L-asparaginase II